ncbi:hypothetical protein Tco_0847055, partial [Tanacetum coccineum]
ALQDGRPKLNSLGRKASIRQFYDKAWVDNWRDSSLKWTSSNSLALDKATGTIELWKYHFTPPDYQNIQQTDHTFDCKFMLYRINDRLCCCSIRSTIMVSGNGSSDSEVQRTMLELLNLLDGFEASNNIKNSNSSSNSSFTKRKKLLTLLFKEVVEARTEDTLEELDTGKSSKARDLGDLKNMINTSTEARGADELTDKKIDASHAWVKAGKAQENEILMKVEMIQRMISASARRTLNELNCIA